MREVHAEWLSEKSFSCNGAMAFQVHTANSECTHTHALMDTRMRAHTHTSTSTHTHTTYFVAASRRLGRNIGGCGWVGEARLEILFPFHSTLHLRRGDRTHPEDMNNKERAWEMENEPSQA